MKNKLKKLTEWIGLLCLALALGGNYLWSFPTWLCSALSGVFLLSLVAGFLKTKEQKQQEESDRQERIKSLGR